MARMPGAVWQGEHSPKRRMQKYDIVCIHTIVGYAPAHAAHFSVKADGTILQSRDTAYQSGANLYGNPRIIAIENEDHGDAFPRWTGNDVPPLTDAQIKANARILAWAHQTHGIPLQLCPDSRPTSRGLAYHRQGIDGNFGSFRFPGRVAGGEVWTTSYGKVCPGDNRIAQRDDILALARGDRAPKETPVTARMNPANYYLGARGPWVTWLGGRLVAHGYARHHDGNGYQPGPVFTKYDRENVQDFQHAQGWTGADADGYPGRETLKRLAATPAKPQPTPEPTTRPNNVQRARAWLERARNANKGRRLQQILDALKILPKK